MATADRPAGLVRLAARLLSDRDAAWGRAMLGELPSVEGRASRWRFARGCLVAALFSPVRLPGFALGVTLLATADATVVATALVRYPGLRSGGAIWVAVPAALAVLAAYALAATALARRTSGLARTPVAAALVGGLLVGAAWTGLEIATSHGAHGVAGPLILVGFPLTCLAVGTIAARRAGPAATLVVLMTGALSGLVVFLAWTADAVVRAGRPYDVGLVRDFHSSGASDLATYAVNDTLGSGMMLLLVVPLLTVFLGLAGQAAATLALRRRP